MFLSHTLGDPLKSEKIEKETKDLLIQRMESEESAEKVILEEAQLEESEEDSLDSDDSYDEDELNKKRERKTKRKKDVRRAENMIISRQK